MTETEIANALRQHLAGVSGAPDIVWENAPGVWDEDAGEWVTPETPHWRASQVKAPPTRPGLDEWHKFSGRLVVAVLAEDGSFTATAEAQAEAVVAHFKGQKLTAGDGKITIRERPYIDDGYNDGGYWRVNVHVRWEAME